MDELEERQPIQMKDSELADGPAIYIHGIYITTVTQVDVDFEGLDAPTLAKMIGEKVKDEILAYRERRSESGRTESIIAAISWTAIFVAFSVMLWFGSRYLIRHADHKIVSWVRRVEDTTGKIAKTNAIASTTRVAFWTITFLVFVIAFYCTVLAVLRGYHFISPALQPPAQHFPVYFVVLNDQNLGHLPSNLTLEFDLSIRSPAYRGCLLVFRSSFM